MKTHAKFFIDERGSLIAFDNIEEFKIKRFFFIECKKNSWRGDHYHKKVNQKIYVIDGKIEYIIEDRHKILNGTLEKGESILHETFHKFKFCSITDTSKLIVFCDNTFDKDDYFTDWSSSEVL